MISFVCHFYSWAYDDCLKLPIKAFFSFYQEAVKMEASQYRERLDIAATPSMKFEYYKYLRAKYNALIYPKDIKLPEKPPEMHIDASSQEARDLVMGLFRSVKRGMGYV